MASIHITLTAFLYQLATTGAFDPCSDFWTLDQPWRSTSYTPGPNDPLQCDRFLDPGWYRFAGGGMPTTCPSSFSCGTQAPIWMRDQLPLPNEGVVNRSACAVITNTAGQLDCCGQEVLIQVRNCGDFVVYCLHNTPGCAMAYCSDVQGGTASRQINTQPPAPVLVGPEVIDGGFRFSCNLPDSRPRSSVQEVTWTFDGVQAANAAVETLTGDNDVAYLDQQAWTGHVGSELRCRVRVRNDVTGQFGDFVDSNGYWGGIRVTPTSVTVTEGEGAQEVTLTSTLPIVCSHDNECELQLELDVNGTRWEDIAATESCVLHLRREDWDVSTKTVSVTTRIVATRDVIRDGDQSLAVRFRPLFSLAPPLWHNYTPPEIQVRTVDRTVARCYGYADPHIQTFDRQSVYHLYEEGDFVLLRSVPNNFEIHVRTFACAGRSCICGVAVQRDYDAISLSVCEGQGVLPPEVRVLSDHGLQASTTVTRTPDGREYMLAFTTGEWVKITDFSSYLNVEVQVTGSEFGVTSGLCGTFDNNPDNDFTSIDGAIHPDSDVPLSFTESWRLQPQDSLLNGVLRPVTEGFSRDNTQLCTCNAASGSIDCGLTRGIMDPARDLHRDCHHCDITDDIIRWRENSAVGDDTEDNDRPIVLIDNEACYSGKPSLCQAANLPPVDPDVQWVADPTEGWGSPAVGEKVGEGPVTPPPTLPPVTSRDIARHVCVSAMTNLTLTAHCATAVKMQMESFVTSCVEDMMSAGSPQFLVAAVASWERACAGDVTSNPQSYPLDNRGRLQPPPLLMSEVCPGVCGLRGRCVNGVCVCNPGYTGDNCLVRADYPPVILRIVRNGLCDARQRPCVRAFLQLDNFWPGPRTACRIRDAQMTDNGVVADSEGRPVTASIESDRQVACPVADSTVPDDKAVRFYLISITTDGSRYSNEALYVVYDAVCLQCDVAGTCTVQAGTCWIENRCYVNQQVNPFNSNLLCDPLRSNARWSPAVISVKVGTTHGDVTCPEMTSTFKRWDVWTSNQTGCTCHFNPASQVCACCEAGACQCPLPNMHQCVQCGMESRDCGQRHPAPEFGVDGWTSSLTGCACGFDWSRDNCACCQNGGCQCSPRFRNQCVPCGHPEVCGTKPDVFGPPLD